MGRWDDRWWPPPSKPRPAEGGIRSRSRRGAFGTSWWASRWIEVLEGFGIGARLGRGRSYARKGQVVDIQVEPGEVTARVQGSRARPYAVTIGLEPLSEGERTAVARELTGRPRLAATLLAGEMPRELEEAFAEAGVPLFPERHVDLETDCSCPDWSNPCKHIAAVHYLLAEELDRNPFFLLRLRGFARSDLVEPAGEEPDAPAASGSADERAAGQDPEVPAEPLPSDPLEFWEGVDPDDGASEVREASDGTSEAHLRALGRIPFWRGEQDPGERLAEMIGRAGPLGVELLAGPEWEPEDQK